MGRIEDRQRTVLAERLGVPEQVAEELRRRGLTTVVRARSASVEALQGVPGIGQTIARRIRGD